MEVQMNNRVLTVITLFCLTAVCSNWLVASPIQLRPRKRRTLVQSWQAPQRGKVKVAMFDADSTLRVTRSGAPCANHPRDVILLPLVAERIKKLAEQGYLIAVLSNQGGVGRGFIKVETADAGLRRTCQLLNRAGAPVHYYDFAENYDENRKPKPGMAYLIQRAVSKGTGLAVDWVSSFMVGDSGWKKKKDMEPDGTPGSDHSNSDRGFAESVRERLAGGQGMKFHHPRTFFGWNKYGVKNFHKLQQVKDFIRKYPHYNPGVNYLGMRRRRNR